MRASYPVRDVVDDDRRSGAAIVHRRERMIPLLHQSNETTTRQQCNQRTAHGDGSARSSRCCWCTADGFGITKTRAKFPPMPIHHSLNSAAPRCAGRSRRHARRRFVCVGASRCTHLSCRIPDFELDDGIAQLDGLREECGCGGERESTSERANRRGLAEGMRSGHSGEWRVGDHQQPARAYGCHPRS